LGIYLNIDFYNKSPKSGLISEAFLILYRNDNISEKYVLEFTSFRLLDSTKTIYKDSEERFPLVIMPKERINKTLSFLYNIEEQFPITMDVYNAELVILIGDNNKPKYIEKFKIDITKDVLDSYTDKRDKKSTSVEWISVLGYTPMKSKKITEKEYINIFN